MGITSLQVCMDSASSDNWLQGTSHEDSPGMESSPSPLSPTDVLTCSRPLTMERRLRPPHDQSLKCPRCDSAHTKFCYYNNYSLTQPRYFCKTCRRYWTKGGTLRNIPVGGGCRKNKKSSSKKKNDTESPVICQSNDSNSNSTTDLQLSFPDQVQFSHISSLFGAASLHHHHHHPHNPSFLPIDFMESKMEGIVGNSHDINDNNYEFMGNNNINNNNNNSNIGDLGMVNLGGVTTNSSTHGLLMEHNFHHYGNICAPFGVSLLDESNVNNNNNNNNNNVSHMDTCHRLMLPYGNANHEEQNPSPVDVKPSSKLLSLDKDSFRYLNAWSSGMMMNNYGQSSTTNPLV